ncbi:unnamed protein product, partial [Rotaria sordida]
HANGAVITRGSQPEVSWLLRCSKEDESMIQAIINACKDTLTANSIRGETNLNRLLILHLGTRDAAIEDYAKYYADSDVEFMNLPHIHATTSTQWLQHLSALIKAASYVVANVDKHNRPVLVHCSNGGDHTPQIITLAEIMLDSHYRTINSFQILVEREWIQFGHKFGDRCGHAQHTYSSLYGTFLCNTDFERTTANLEKKTLGVWSLLNIQSTQFINPSFNETIKEVLYPSCSIHNLRIWSNLYLCDMPVGSSERPSSTSTIQNENNNNDRQSTTCKSNGLPNLFKKMSRRRKRQDSNSTQRSACVRFFI